MHETSKQHITETERLTLIGLRTLALEQERLRDRLVTAAVAITGEINSDGKPHDWGHTGDWLTGGCGNNEAVERMLARLSLNVVEDQPTTEEKLAAEKERNHAICGAIIDLMAKIGSENRELAKDERLGNELRALKAAAGLA